MYHPLYNPHIYTHPPTQSHYDQGPLELGGATYQYFITDVSRTSQMGPDGPLPPNSRSPILFMPIAGPFNTFLEASQYMEKLLHGNLTIVILPSNMFLGARGR